MDKEHALEDTEYLQNVLKTQIPSSYQIIFVEVSIKNSVNWAQCVFTIIIIKRAHVLFLMSNTFSFKNLFRTLTL